MIHKSIRIGTWVLLTDGRVGRVLYISPTRKFISVKGIPGSISSAKVAGITSEPGKDYTIEGELLSNMKTKSEIGISKKSTPAKKIKPLKWVAQKSEDVADCGIACVAMVSGKTYAEAAAATPVQNRKDGTHFTSYTQIIKGLQALNPGIITKRVTFERLRSIEGIAILATNKRADGDWHWVVFDGRAEPYVLDPKPHKKDKVTDFRGLNPFGKYILIMNE